MGGNCYSALSSMNMCELLIQFVSFNVCDLKSYSLVPVTPGVLDYRLFSGGTSYIHTLLPVQTGC